MDWFLYEKNLRHESVKEYSRIFFIAKSLKNVLKELASMVKDIFDFKYNW